MTHTVPLPPSIQNIVDLLIDAAWRGRGALVSACGRPDDLRRSNTRTFAGVAAARSTVRILQRIVRYTFIILAAWIKLPKARAVPSTPAATSSAQEPGRRPPARLAMSRAVRVCYAGERPVPACFANTAHDPVRALARGIEALTHALQYPMPYVRRLARWMRRDTCFLAWRLPKRPPVAARRTYWEELELARDQASWELQERRWLADSS